LEIQVAGLAKQTVTIPLLKALDIFGTKKLIAEGCVRDREVAESHCLKN